MYILIFLLGGKREAEIDSEVIERKLKGKHLYLQVSIWGS